MNDDFPYKATYRLVLSIGFPTANQDDEEFHPPEAMSEEEWSNIEDHGEFLWQLAKETYEDCIEFSFKQVL